MDGERDGDSGASDRELVRERRVEREDERAGIN